MSSCTQLTGAMGIRQGEGAMVAALFVHSVLLGTALIFTMTAANALFISRVGPQGLPYVYLAIAAVGPLTSTVYLRLVHWFSERVAWRANLVFIAAVFLALRYLLDAGDAAIGAFGLLIWYRVAEGLLNLEFWGVSGSLLDVRQAKRLYGLIGTGEVLAIVAGGLGVDYLVPVLGTENLRNL